jgi:hypothetical protein
MSAVRRERMLREMLGSPDRRIRQYAEAVLEHFTRARDLGWDEDRAMERALVECRNHQPEVF